MDISLRKFTDSPGAGRKGRVGNISRGAGLRPPDPPREDPLPAPALPRGPLTDARSHRLGLTDLYINSSFFI